MVMLRHLRTILPIIAICSSAGIGFEHRG
jgi:hypothetical protein